MSNTFLLPDLGEGLTEADIVRWLVAEGDTVAVVARSVEAKVVEEAADAAGVDTSTDEAGAPVDESQDVADGATIEAQDAADASVPVSDELGADEDTEE